MNELLTNLGIDAKLFIAQLINFGILLFVLYRFAYKPVLATMDKRTKKIEKGLADAEESQKKLQEIEEKEKKVMIDARKQAKEIIHKAEVQANVNKEELINVAKEESDKIIKKAKEATVAEKEKLISEVKAEVASLVVVAVEKVIDEKLDDVKDAQIINNVID